MDQTYAELHFGVLV